MSEDRATMLQKRADKLARRAAMTAKWGKRIRWTGLVILGLGLLIVILSSL